MKLTPLFKMKEITADKLVARMRREAEELRKEKKRNTISGVHKYLELLQGKREYPCLVDKDGVIISFPPITNCDITKVSRDTTDILVEVTSSVSLETCKLVMQETLVKLLEMGLGQAAPVAHPPAVGAVAAMAAPCEDPGGEGDDEEVAEGPTLTQDQVLVLEQVRVVDESGGLKVLYPSRVDLQSPAFKVNRDYE